MGHKAQTKVAAQMDEDGRVCGREDVRDCEDETPVEVQLRRLQRSRVRYRWPDCGWGRDRGPEEVQGPTVEVGAAAQLMSYGGPGARGPATGPVALAPEAEGARYVRWPWRVWLNNSVWIGAGAKGDAD